MTAARFLLVAGLAFSFCVVFAAATEIFAATEFTNPTFLGKLNDDKDAKEAVEKYNGLAAKLNAPFSKLYDDKSTSAKLKKVLDMMKKMAEQKSFAPYLMIAARDLYNNFGSIYETLKSEKAGAEAIKWFAPDSELKDLLKKLTCFPIHNAPCLK